MGGNELNYYFYVTNKTQRDIDFGTTTIAADGVSLSDVSVGDNNISPLCGGVIRIEATVPMNLISRMEAMTANNLRGTMIYNSPAYYVYMSKDGMDQLNKTINFNFPNTNGKWISSDKIEAFVQRLYEKCLGRMAETNGLRDWSNKLSDGDSTGADTAAGFVFSQEYKNKNTSNDEYVEMLYQVFLDRNSDSAGKNDWVNKLSNGMSREFVCSGFINSTEFAGICKSYGIEPGNFSTSKDCDRNAGVTAFAARCYTMALGRSFDEEGLNYWCKKILDDPSWNAERVASEGFFNSQEFMNKNLSDEDYVKTLYRTFMGREYDAAGLADWTNRLKNGSSRDDVLKGFSRSREFAGIMASYGL